MRGFTTLSKQLFRGNSSAFNESTAYWLIFNLFYTKQLDLTIFRVYHKKKPFIREVTDFFATGAIQFTALTIHSYGIRKRRLSVAQLTEIQWHQGCNVIGYYGTCDPSWPLRFLQ